MHYTTGEKSRLVAVVVTYNRREQLLTTLGALCASTQETLAAIVVCDNASTDGTAQDLAAVSDPRVHVVSLPENRGGAGGFEAGMRVAMADHRPDWLVVMDDDGRPTLDTLAAFHATDRTVADAWAAAVRYPSGAICDMNRPWINPFRSIGDFTRCMVQGRDGFHLRSDAYDGGEVRQIDGGSFVGFFVSAKTVMDAQYPDPSLFLYGDDVLYTLGLSQSGRSILFDPKLRFEHDCETLADEGPVIRPLWKVYFFHRNQVLVYRKAAGPILFWGVLVVRTVQWWLRARHYGSDRSRYLKLLKMAVSDGVMMRTGQSRTEIETVLAEVP